MAFMIQTFFKLKILTLREPKRQNNMIAQGASEQGWAAAWDASPISASAPRIRASHAAVAIATAIPMMRIFFIAPDPLCDRDQLTDSREITNTNKCCRRNRESNIDKSAKRSDLKVSSDAFHGIFLSWSVFAFERAVKVAALPLFFCHSLISTGPAVEFGWAEVQRRIDYRYILIEKQYKHFLLKNDKTSTNR